MNDPLGLLIAAAVTMLVNFGLSDPVALSLIAALVSMFAGGCAAWSAVTIAKLKTTLGKLEENTNHITEQLVKKAEQVAHAEGAAEGEARGVSEGKDSVRK